MSVQVWQRGPSIEICDDRRAKSALHMNKAAPPGRGWRGGEGDDLGKLEKLTYQTGFVLTAERSGIPQKYAGITARVLAVGS